MVNSDKLNRHQARQFRDIVAPMQAPAQLQATIELLDDIAETRYPADRTMANYFKKRRYIGSKDKAVISENFYTVLRKMGSYSWLLQAAGVPINSKHLCAVLLKELGLSSKEYFIDQQYAPGRLPETIEQALDAIDLLTLDEAPQWVKLNIPEWLYDSFVDVYADKLIDEMSAINSQACTDIRVNTLKSTRKQVLHFLSKAGLEAKATTLAPSGLRFDKRVALFSLPIFKQGWFEIQDEGSQLLALLSGAKAGQTVVDFCAGAGGKTLAMAALMKNKGSIYACDVHSKRLEQLSIRAKRAGVHNIRTHVLSSEKDKWVKKRLGFADVVLIDAPCSGTGTWRRSPDSRWNLSAESLANLSELQSSILESASRLVKPGGTLIYATCSVLRQENENQDERFLHANEGFVPAKELLDRFALDESKVDIDEHRVRTSASKTGTDAFFASIMMKKA